ncbi:hypothetical protein D3H55_20930 [Bacillus salacetis]|uniref:Uncharacterized protein n=2 Tax=Bacillus salacetis TaxID=2315464 RepID=A0A3A1QNX5_9BACI|nr:hypothetical protein D3H55_20930 [Bacillus salacetis]
MEEYSFTFPKEAWYDTYRLKDGKLPEKGSHINFANILLNKGISERMENMKKLWWLGLAILLAVAGCSDNGGNDNAGNNAANDAEGTEDAEETADASGAMMDFYLNMTSTLNGIDNELNDYEAALGGEEAPSAEMKTAAAESAAASSEAVKGLEVSGDLSKYEEELETFKTTLAEAYDMKAAELEKEEVNFDAANEKFAEAEEQIASLLEEAGLVKSSLTNDING